MRRFFAICIIALVSCTPRFQEMSVLLQDPAPIDIPFDERFLDYAADMDSFTTLDQQLPDTLERIVFCGSSSIRMWKSLKMDMDSLPYTIVNRGFGGSTLPDVNYYFDRLISPHHAKAVVLYCGENDISDGQKAKDVFSSFYTFLRLFLKDNPNGKLLYVSMKPSPSRWELWPEFEQGNTLIENYISRLKSDNIDYVDISKSMIDTTTKEPIPDIFIADKLHMNAEGYKYWTQDISDALWCLLE